MIRRDGFVLALAVLLVLVLGIAAAGVLSMGAAERVVAHAAEEQARVTLAAESAARLAVHRWSSRRVVDLGPGEARPVEGPTLDGITTSLLVRRIARAAFLVTARAEAGRPGATAAVGRAAILVRTTDADALADAFPVAVDTGSAAGAPDEPPAAGEWLAPAFLRRFASSELDGGVVEPRADSEDGRCVPGPSNWGSVDPRSPCFDLLPLLYSTAALTARGGQGRGLLVVDGDLTLHGTRFDGVLVVNGTLTLEDGARVRGGVRAAAARLAGGSAILDPATVRSALLSGGLDRAFRPAGRWWLAPF